MPVTSGNRSARPQALIFGCGVAFLQFVGAYMRIPLVPLFARNHGATAEQVRRIVALFMLMATLVAIPVGRVSDRLGRRVVLGVGVGIGLLVSAALPFTQRIGALMALYAAAGVGVAVLFSPVCPGRGTESPCHRTLLRGPGHGQHSGPAPTRSAAGSDGITRTTHPRRNGGVRVGYRRDRFPAGPVGPEHPVGSPGLGHGDCHGRRRDGAG